MSLSPLIRVFSNLTDKWVAFIICRSKSWRWQSSLVSDLDRWKCGSRTEGQGKIFYQDFKGILGLMLCLILFAKTCGELDLFIAGPNWSKLRLTANSWRDAVRIWRRRTGGCRKKFRSWEHWSFPRSSTCKWPHPQHLRCVLRVSVWQSHHPLQHQPLIRLGLLIRCLLPIITDPSPSTLGPQLLPSLMDPLISSVLDRDCIPPARALWSFFRCIKMVLFL